MMCESRASSGARTPATVEGMLERLGPPRARRPVPGLRPALRARRASAGHPRRRRVAASRLSNETGTVWAVQNGELYNFPELRPELRARGHRLAHPHRHRDDPPPLRGARARASPRAPEGMFAIGLWDDEPQVGPPGPRPYRQEAALLPGARRRALLRLGDQGAPAGARLRAAPGSRSDPPLSLLQARPGSAHRVRGHPQPAARPDPAPGAPAGTVRSSTLLVPSTGPRTRRGTRSTSRRSRQRLLRA